MADQDDRSNDEISRRSYRRFEERGNAHGNDQEDWFEAEREIRHRQPPQTSQLEPAGKLPGDRDTGPGNTSSASEYSSPALTGARTASSSGRICASCLRRMTKSHALSNFFQPAL